MSHNNLLEHFPKLRFDSVDRNLGGVLILTLPVGT